VIRRARPEDAETVVHGCRLIRETDGAADEERTPDALYRWASAGREA
jgi:hypothetical protein